MQKRTEKKYKMEKKIQFLCYFKFFLESEYLRMDLSEPKAEFQHMTIRTQRYL
jgi:hypothetical protein